MTVTDVLLAKNLSQETQMETEGNSRETTTTTVQSHNVRLKTHAAHAARVYMELVGFL